MGLLGSILGTVASAAGSLIGGGKQKKAADRAAQLQYDAAMAGLNETRRQFDITRGDYAPYQAVGISALPHFQSLIGIGGVDAQMAEIDALKASPFYQGLYNNGRDAMLATASATGGLRGGNFQDATARFGADTLNAAIDRQLANYSTAIGLGTGATDAVSQFGERAVAMGNAQRNAGADAKAQAQLIRGGIDARNWSNIGSSVNDILGQTLGRGGFSRMTGDVSRTISSNPGLF